MKRYRNGILNKKTVHFYKNEFETHRFEYFYKPDYQVYTVFEYEFWE